MHFLRYIFYESYNSFHCAYIVHVDGVTYDSCITYILRFDPQVRVGEVGGNTLGLYGGVFGPHGNLILAHGYQGAFHLWKRASSLADKIIDQSEDQDDQPLSQSRRDHAVSDGGDRVSELWEPLPTLSGHFGPVQDISWEPREGEFLISVSLDQTSRLHAPWISEGVGQGHVTWQEVARPQIHGYDMQCIAMTTPLQYVSGADEKVGVA